MPLVKLLGLIIVFVCCCLFGLFKSSALRRRVVLLEEVISGLSCLKEQIRLCGGELKTVLPLCLKNVNAIRVSADSVTIEKTGLDSEDILILKRLFDSLGSGDTTAEFNRIERSISMLERQNATAIKELNQKGKLWQNGGICVGTAICILLI